MNGANVKLHNVPHLDVGKSQSKPLDCAVDCRALGQRRIAGLGGFQDAAVGLDSPGHQDFHIGF